jgi:WD40 repeat protein
LATGSADRTIKLWDLATHVEVATLHGQSGTVESLAFSPRGDCLASGSEGLDGTDNLLWFWEVPDSDGPSTAEK